MTGVGLIGLAVGHGLAHQGRAAAGGPVQDPLIIKGFVALTQHVGEPAGRTEKLPMNNLYFLWSLERVAVLYNLPKIGKKDWYRWGAEILVANQGPNGEWDKGGYPGAHPVLDTCLALLFLRRANLASDLTSRLPFSPEQLDTDIGKSQEREQPPPPPTLPSGPTPGQIASQTPTLPSAPANPPTREQPASAPTTAPSPAAETAQDTTGGGGRRWLWVVIGVCVLLLLGSGAAIWLGLSRKTEEEPPRKRRKSKKKKREDTEDDDG
jgi:hypothetical protein